MPLAQMLASRVFVDMEPTWAPNEGHHATVDHGQPLHLCGAWSSVRSPGGSGGGGGQLAGNSPVLRLLLPGNNLTDGSVMATC